MAWNVSIIFWISWRSFSLLFLPKNPRTTFSNASQFSNWASIKHSLNLASSSNNFLICGPTNIPALIYSVDNLRNFFFKYSLVSLFWPLTSALTFSLRHDWHAAANRVGWNGFHRICCSISTINSCVWYSHLVSQWVERRLESHRKFSSSSYSSPIVGVLPLSCKLHRHLSSGPSV